MDRQVIHKPVGVGETPNMVDYVATRAAFSWDAAREALAGLPGGRGVNMAHEAVDRWATGPRAHVAALRCVDRAGRTEVVTFAELSNASSRLANVLQGLGVAPGEAVFALLPRGVTLHTVVLGSLKHRAVFSPLFSAFGPEPVRQRLALGSARVLVTTPALYRRKVAPILADLPGLRHVLVTTATGPAPEGATNLDELMSGADDRYVIGPTDPEDPALLHFTSGTTGTPKGAVHVHDAVVAHLETGRLALDLRPGDVWWCTADPGWVTGISYGVLAPLLQGVTSVVDTGDFDVERWYRVLERERVSVWYTAPTALRMLMQAGPDAPARHDLSHLRFVASVGEPLNPEVVMWGDEVLGRPIHDNWWQTETGGIMIANYQCMDIRPGSMGRPLPGVEATVLARDARGRVRRDQRGDPVEAAPGAQGELALRRGWPSMFRGYLGEEPRYRACFAGDWYLSGDLVIRDEDGYFWFVGRGDDVIKSAGHLIGPFEVESALLEHEAVAEAGVIGKPDDTIGEVVKAFVTLRHGYEPSEQLRLDILGFARRRLGPAVAPREIAFDEHLPHTGSGKIMRRLLRARELGLPEGDTSTLESSR